MPGNGSGVSSHPERGPAMNLVIGLIDAHARRAAWRRIAVARREVQERELALLHHADPATPPTRRLGVSRSNRR
jgi:hypothetical protein